MLSKYIGHAYQGAYGGEKTRPERKREKARGREKARRPWLGFAGARGRREARRG
jgi:hypothetical protein